jgi:hypothetical protein
VGIARRKAVIIDQESSSSEMGVTVDLLPEVSFLKIIYETSTIGVQRRDADVSL